MLSRRCCRSRFAPALRDAPRPRQDQARGEAPGLAPPDPRLRAVRVRRAAAAEVHGRHRRVRARLGGPARAAASATSSCRRSNEGDMLYMPTTLPEHLDRGGEAPAPAQDAILRSFPEVETVFGKVGRAETRDRSGAAHDGRDDRAAAPAGDVAQDAPRGAGTRRWAPGWLKPRAAAALAGGAPHDMGRADRRR